MSHAGIKSVLIRDVGGTPRQIPFAELVATLTEAILDEIESALQIVNLKTALLNPEKEDIRDVLREAGFISQSDIDAREERMREFTRMTPASERFLVVGGAS